MTQAPDPFGAGAWQAFGPAAAAAWDSRAAGTDALAAWCRGVADGLRDAICAAPADPAALRHRLERFAIAFFSGGPNAGPAFGALRAFGAPAALGAGAPVPALGPAREHQQRAAALATAVAELAAANHALAPLLADAARAAATAFAARFAVGPPLGVRPTFDLWIECAEAAWQDLAHGEAWCRAQARAFDAALSVAACQREIAEHAARLAGLPGRAEIDELHRRVRELERDR